MDSVRCSHLILAVCVLWLPGTLGAGPRGAPEPAAPPGRSRVFTLINACNFTVWPAARGAVQVLGPGGLELAPGGSADVFIPYAWVGNWSPRTGCHFNASGHGPCATGGCAGDSLACTEDASVVPMDRTQAEFNLNSWGDLDYYDLNLFSYNTAVSIRPSNPACQPSGCARDLLPHCPGSGAITDSRGDAVVCRSACALYLDVEHCLSPSAVSRQTKLSCPHGTVSYMADHAVLACPGSPNYMLTFCGVLP